MNIYASSEKRDDRKGYKSYPYRREHAEKNSAREAEKELKKYNKAVIRMHKYVINILGNLNQI